MKKMLKRFAIFLVLMALVLPLCFVATGCEVDWVLLEEGIVTDVDMAGHTLTFDGERVVILDYNYALECPSNTIILGGYYCLYKEDARAVWNGYHLTKEPINRSR